VFPQPSGEAEILTSPELAAFTCESSARRCTGCRVSARPFSRFIFTLSTARRSAEKRALLRSGLLSMTEDGRAYKRVAKDFDRIIRWLDE
jgi:hypothetical protein